MDISAVVKVGGSIIKIKALRPLCNELSGLARAYKIVLIAGGGELADMVRELQKEHNLSNSAAHWMAIMGMDINGMLISDLHNNFEFAENKKECMVLFKQGKVPILLTYNILKEEDELPRSWDATSDSIALYIAHRLGAEKTILLKDVEGLFTKNGKLVEEISAQELKRWRGSCCVDSYIPALVSEYNKGVWVLSGLHPGRIKTLLEGGSPKGTFIIP